MTDDLRRRLTAALAAVHRRHRRNLLGNCRCGWRRNQLDVHDHSDHAAGELARVIMQALT